MLYCCLCPVLVGLDLNSAPCLFTCYPDNLYDGHIILEWLIFFRADKEHFCNTPKYTNNGRSVFLSLAPRPILTDNCMWIYMDQDHVDYEDRSELPEIGMEVL